MKNYKIYNCHYIPDQEDFERNGIGIVPGQSLVYCVSLSACT